MRFAETRLEQAGGNIRLVDSLGMVLLELRGREVDDAAHAGFIDLTNLHYSMFEYAKIRTLSFDGVFLSSIGIGGVM